jgi:starvation-inducible outer membrane lipoprotein
MKILLLITATFLTGCASLPSILKNDLTACFEAQKSMSRDQTMRDIAVLEMAKTANDQTKMAAISQINNKPQQNLTCK